MTKSLLFTVFRFLEKYNLTTHCDGIITILLNKESNENKEISALRVSISDN